MPRKRRSAKATAKAEAALKFVSEGRVIDRAKYSVIRNGRTVLEAVYRIQTAQQVHTCDKEDCLLGESREILPLQDYARVYYEDEDEFEKFHKACFREEFQTNA